ncbi:MAG: putative HTH-type transcriptional repressor ExuR [Candidatus Celerinatantimonas neptuna]|nr:MAG: putative HTH-type transcriptional repressor ExuR [Candidatus Celerinatantimonas neptuna]
MNQKSITAQDVANLAGVSRAVVSRTFSNNGSVAPATRQKVLTAAQQLGYQVNILAQSLNRQRSTLIGLVTSGLTDPYRSQLLEDLVRHIQQQNFQALVCDILTSADLPQTLLKLTQFRVSGVIVTSGHPSAELVRECVRLSIPVVVINRMTDIPVVDVITSDNQAGAQLAVQTLKQSGCQQLAFLGIDKDTYSGQARLKAWQQLTDGRLFPAPHAGYQGGVLAARQILTNRLPFDGLWCANDLLACGFLDTACNEFNLKAPSDYKIIGFDDIPTAGFTGYQLTTLKQNTAQIASLALERLHQRTSDIQQPQRIDHVPVQLIQRQTT